MGKFSQPFVEQVDNKCNQMIKRLEFNEGFKQLARGNLNFLLETEIKAWSEQTNTNQGYGRQFRYFINLTSLTQGDEGNRTH